MNVNQQGHPIEEQSISYSYLTLEEKKHAVQLLFEHLKLDIVRTNATKYGDFGLVLRSLP
jgi:hypothetical protein